MVISLLISRIGESLSLINKEFTLFSVSLHSVNISTLFNKVSQNSNPVTDSGVFQRLDPHLAKLNSHLSMLHDHFKAQMTYAERLENERRQRQHMDWCDGRVESLGLEEL